MKKIFWMVMLLAVMMVLFTSTCFATDYYAKNRVNVRQSADTTSKIIGVLDTNEVVVGIKVVTDEDGKNWVYVESKYGNGYVSQNSLAVCYDGENEQLSPKTISLKVTKNLKLTALNGKEITIKKGTTVKATKFYPTKNGTKAQIKIGKNEVLVFVKYLRKTNGNKISDFARSVRLKKAYNLNGEKLKKGQKLSVEFYFFGKDGELYADVHEGYIATSLLNKA